METARIRDFEADDFNAVVELWKLIDLGSPQRGDNLNIILQSIAMGGKMLVAINQGNDLIGTSWMTFDGRRMHLHHFGVHPNFQRKGVGKLLVKESLRFVKQKGYQVKLEVHQSNTAAINLYRQAGFKFLGDYDVYIIRDIETL